MAQEYESGRPDLPFVGISGFGSSPCHPEWLTIDAGIDVLWVAGSRTSTMRRTEPWGG